MNMVLKLNLIHQIDVSMLCSPVNSMVKYPLHTILLLADKHVALMIMQPFWSKSTDLCCQRSLENFTQHKQEKGLVWWKALVGLNEITPLLFSFLSGNWDQWKPLSNPSIMGNLHIRQYCLLIFKSCSWRDYHNRVTTMNMCHRFQHVQWAN